MMKMRDCIITFFVVTVLFLPGFAAAETWDLKADWSDTYNPNGRPLHNPILSTSTLLRTNSGDQLPC